MNTYICLLRGVNVSGQNKIPMKELKQGFETLNYSSVQTYIQSGNIVFNSSETIKNTELNIKRMIMDTFGFDIPVLVFDVDYLKKIYSENPFLKSERFESDFFHVTILKHDTEVDELPSNTDKDDCWEISNRCIYLYCPNGYGRTKFTNTFFERKLKVEATTRNWKTLTTLIELSSS